MLDFLADILFASLAISHAHAVILKELVVLILLLLLVLLVFLVIFSAEPFENEVDKDSLRNEAEFSEGSHVEILVLDNELDQASDSLEEFSCYLKLFLY